MFILRSAWHFAKWRDPVFKNTQEDAEELLKTTTVCNIVPTTLHTTIYFCVVIWIHGFFNTVCEVVFDQICSVPELD